jgi:hypothetical protein
MGRMSFSQELRSLSESSQEVNSGERFAEVVRLHRELGRNEYALGRAGWTLRYGARGEWRGVLREAAADTLREARRAASRYDEGRLRKAARDYATLAGCGFADAAAVMLRPGERAAASNHSHRQQRREFGRVAAEVRWTTEPHGGEDRRRGRGHGARRRKNRRGRAAVAA